jgi:predicted dehydrogenase
MCSLRRMGRRCRCAPAEAFRVLPPAVKEGPVITPYLQYQTEMAWEQNGQRRIAWEGIRTEQDLLFMPFLNRALEWARTAGSLRYVRCTMTRYERREPEFLWATAVHAVDALRHIAGEVVDAKIRALGHAGASAEWYALDLSFENGVSGRLDVLPTAGMLEETYELIGEGFRAVVTCPFGPQRGLRCFRENRLALMETASESMPEDVLNGCYDEAAEFIRALTRKEPARPSIEEVFPSVQLCLTMAKSVEENAGRMVPAKT